MAKIINKIAFLVHEPTMYDHWIGVWRLMDRGKFEIVLLDVFRNSDNEHFRNNAERFINRISKENYSYRFWGNIISEEIKYSYVVSNHVVQGETLNENEPLPLKIKFKNQIKIILNLLLRSLESSKSYSLVLNRQYLPVQIGVKRIRFMYGADINDGWSLAKWNEMFDIFLCHGPNDEHEINKRFMGMTFQMGYPRYDDYFNVSDLGGNLRKTFACAPDKKTIVWLPTLGEGTCSIPHYAEQISQLTKNYNVIVRPHPITFRAYPENINILERLHFTIDDDSLRDMNALYQAADFVICDYGGTQFSALYLDKNIVLLNTPGATEWITSKGASDWELRKELSPVLDVNDVKYLKDILCDESVWAKQAEQRKIAFAKYFAPYRGTSAKRVVSILNNVLANDSAAISEK